MTQTIKIQQYTGASLLNARQLNLSMNLMTGALKGGQKPSAITQAQVMELLNVIESLAMSAQVLFDNSIQPADKQLLIANNRLYRNLLTPTALVAGDEWLQCCEQAATQSRLLIQKWLASPTEWPQERAVPAADAQAFKHTLFEGLALTTSATGDELRLYAGKILHELSFLGTKCVAGLLLAMPDENARVALKEAFALAERNGVLGEFVAGLVNRFRVNFVNELASQHDAAYVAAPMIEGLKTQQSMLLWRFLGARMSTDISSKFHAESELEKASAQALTSFPYAYALLMQKKVTTPTQLLDLLFKVRDEAVIRMQATEQGSGKRYIHDWNADEFFENQQGLFESTYMGLTEYQESWRDMLLNVGRSCLPAVLSVGSAGLGIVIPDSAVESAIAVSMASAGLAVERRAQNTSGQAKVKLYRDNYMRWNKLLDKAATRAGGGVQLIGRVEDIFGVKVVG